MNLGEFFDHEDAFYVRQIEGLSVWKDDPNDEPDEERRVEDTVDSIFSDENDGKYSLYRVGSSFDLQAVVVGLNSGRKNDQNIDLISFRHEELANVGAVFIEDAAGTTACGFANALHLDISADTAQLSLLVQAAFAAGRKPRRVGKKKYVKPIAKHFVISVNCNAQTSQQGSCNACSSNSDDKSEFAWAAPEN